VGEQLVEHVVPENVVNGYVLARDAAKTIHKTVVYSGKVAEVVRNEAFPVRQWVDNTVELTQAAGHLVSVVQKGDFHEIPESFAPFLQKATEAYDRGVKMLKKMPPGERLDAYTFVLNDFGSLLKAADEAYKLGAKSVKVAGPSVARGARGAYKGAAKGVEAIKEATLAVDKAAKRLKKTTDRAHDMTIGRAQRFVSQGDQWVESKLEGRIKSEYERHWATYVNTTNPNMGTHWLRRYVKDSVNGNFGVPVVGEKVFSERGMRLSGMLDWADSSQKALSDKVTLLSPRSHPVMNHFIDVLLRGKGVAASEYLKTGGHWGDLSGASREEAIQSLRSVIEAEADGLLSVDPDTIRPYLPEIEELQQFYGHWDRLTEVERKITLAVMMDFAPPK
jgi:hypothetical protein